MSDQANGLLSPWLREKRLNKVRPHLRGRILDFGCGIGSLAGYCDADGYVGVDIDKASLEVAKERHPAYFFSDQIPESSKFDSIVAMAVIEHLKDPTQLLRTFREALSPAGTVILTTPHPISDSIHCVGSKIGLFSSAAHEEHEALLDCSSMKSICDEADFTITRYERFLFGMNQLFLLTPL